MADLSVLCVNVKYLFFLLQLGGFSVFMPPCHQKLHLKAVKFLPAQPIVMHIWVEFNYVWHKCKLGLEDESRPSRTKCCRVLGDKKMGDERFRCQYTRQHRWFYCDASINQISGFPPLGA